jgi:hypothetical protein
VDHQATFGEVLSLTINVGPEKERPSLFGLCSVAKDPRAALPMPVTLTRCVLSAATGPPTLDLLISLIGHGEKSSPCPPTLDAAFRMSLIAGAYLRLCRSITSFLSRRTSWDYRWSIHDTLFSRRPQQAPAVVPLM